MFSFHKPKIYRSISGCCICKAKSSSSRFTDSKKYESEFERCFRIQEKRSGEICNACVLLVKRWKKLPPGTLRDWHHVVDARAGPGTKSLKTAAKLNGSTTTFSSSPSSLIQPNKKLTKPKRIKSPIITCNSNNVIEYPDEVLDGDENYNVTPYNRIPSPIESESSSGLEDNLEEDDEDDCEGDGKRKRKSRIRVNSKSNRKSNETVIKNSVSQKRNNLTAKNNGTSSRISSFLDMSFWRKEKICCGIIFKGPANEVLIDPKLLEPCSCRKNAVNSKVTGSGSDTSSVTSTSGIEDDTNSNASSSNISLI